MVRCRAGLWTAHGRARSHEFYVPEPVTELVSSALKSRWIQAMRCSVVFGGATGFAYETDMSNVSSAAISSGIRRRAHGFPHSNRRFDSDRRVTP